MTEMRARFGIVVASLGRVESLRSLLETLEAQTSRDFIVSVCAQKNAECIRSALDDVMRRSGLPVEFVDDSASRGAARGRNIAARALSDSVEYLVFPNDTSLYPPTLLEELAKELDGSRAGSLGVVDDTGWTAPLPTPGTPLSRANAWVVHMMGFVLRREAFEELGGFQECLGTGAQSPWQSGEDTDLVLRYLATFRGDDFLWIPRLAVKRHADGRGLSRRERRSKLRAYGRGY